MVHKTLFASTILRLLDTMSVAQVLKFLREEWLVTDPSMSEIQELRKHGSARRKEVL